MTFNANAYIEEDWGDDDVPMSRHCYCDICEGMGSSPESVEHGPNCPIEEIQRLTEKVAAMERQTNERLLKSYETIIGQSWSPMTGPGNFDGLQLAWKYVADIFKVESFDFTKGQKPKAKWDE